MGNKDFDDYVRHRERNPAYTKAVADYFGIEVVPSKLCPDLYYEAKADILRAQQDSGEDAE
jgi:hypothetical protein